MDEGKVILDNLYSLYKYVAKISENTFSNRTNAFSIVYTYESYWPNMIFAIDENKFDEAELDEMCNILAKKKLFPLVIVSENEKLTKLFRVRNFMPVEQWTGMFIELIEPVREYSLSEDFELVTFKPGDDIGKFTETVSGNLFRSNKLDTQLFTSLLSGDRTEMLALFANDQIVGTTMIYYDENNTAGIYMVSANKDFRQKGVGTSLINKALIEIRKRGISHCVLQSTKQAISLYQKAGFEKKSVINLFWKVK